jgi:hypothetical protein
MMDAKSVGIFKKYFCFVPPLEFISYTEDDGGLLVCCRSIS